MCGENVVLEIFLFCFRLSIKLVQKDILMMIFQQKQRKLPSKSHTGIRSILGLGRECWEIVAQVCAAGTSKAIVPGYVQLYFECGGRGQCLLLFSFL